MANADDVLGALQELVDKGILREVEAFQNVRRWEILDVEGIPVHGWLSDMYQAYGEIRWYGS